MNFLWDRCWRSFGVSGAHSRDGWSLLKEVLHPPLGRGAKCCDMQSFLLFYGTFGLSCDMQSVGYLLISSEIFRNLRRRFGRW